MRFEFRPVAYSEFTHRQRLKSKNLYPSICDAFIHLVKYILVNFKSTYLYPYVVMQKSIYKASTNNHQWNMLPTLLDGYIYKYICIYEDIRLINNVIQFQFQFHVYCIRAPNWTKSLCTYSQKSDAYFILAL